MALPRVATLIILILPSDKYLREFETFDHRQKSYHHTLRSCQSYEIFSRAVKKVQVGKDQEKAQSEKDSHSKNRGGKKPN